MIYHQPIILFDGVCNLCNSSIDFILRRDRKNNFLVGALQEKPAREILSDFEVNPEYLDSLVLIEKGEIFYKSDAALKIAKNLSGLWPIFYPLIYLPSGFRNSVYDWIARNRYKWFGKKNTCRLPSPEEASKFLSEKHLPAKNSE